MTGPLLVWYNASNTFTQLLLDRIFQKNWVRDSSCIKNLTDPLGGWDLNSIEHMVIYMAGNSDKPRMMT